MPDPLAEYAERTVPEPTNFFDPEAARTIISRYANTRKEREVLDAVGESAARRQQMEANDIRMERDRRMLTREDEDYHARNEALRQRGDFLRRMGTELDPKDPAYNTKVSAFMAEMPAELAEDESVRGVLHSMNAEADDYRSRSNAEEANKRMLERQQTMFREKTQYGPAFEHVTKEDMESNRLPDGSLDLQALSIIGRERGRAYKEKEFNRRQDLSLQGKLKVIEARDLSKRGRERRTAVDKFIVEDRKAFPPRYVNQVIQDYAASRNMDPAKVTAAALEADGKWKGAFAAAQKQDQYPLNNELSAAFAYDDPDTYINLVPGLSDSQKERRRQVWEHAHRDGAVEENDSPGAPGAPATPPDMKVPATTAPGTGEPTQAPAQRKPLTPDAKADLMKRAGGDPMKARQLAIDEGY